MTETIQSILREHKERGGGALHEEASRQIMRELNIPVVPGGQAADMAAAVELAEELGYPVVMKVLSRQITHKTDVGGVKTDLLHRGDVKRAWRDIHCSVGQHAPAAEVEGVTVQKQLSGGLDLIVGGTRDDHFGAVVVFGLGGLYAESLGEVAFRLAPLSKFEADALMRDTAVWTMLQSFRGGSADIEVIRRSLVSVGRMLHEYPSVRELEINPLTVDRCGEVVALDALVVTYAMENG